MSEVNQYHEGMTLTLGYKTIFVPADKVSSLINTLNKCSELEKEWNEDGSDYYIDKGGVCYRLTKHTINELTIKKKGED
jgi:hypothetical protein